MNARHNPSASSRNRHPRIEPLEARLPLSADFGDFGGEFGPTPHEHWEDFGPRPAFAQWSQESFGAPRDWSDNVGGADFSDRPTVPHRVSDWQPIAMMWQPSTGTLYRIYAPTREPFSELGVPTPKDAGPLRSQAPPNDGPAAAKPQVEPNGPLSLSALELLGAQAELTSYEAAITTADQPAVPSAAALTVASTAQLIAAATPGLEVSVVETVSDEPLSARDAAYANSSDSQWLQVTREEVSEVQQLLDANRLTQEANVAAGDVVETSAAELRPEDYMAADWVNEIVLLAAANSADDAELFLALSGKPAGLQTATKVGLSVADSTPQAEPVAATSELLAPSRTLRWCGAVLAPVLFAAALRDRVKRKAASGVVKSPSSALASSRVV